MPEYTPSRSPRLGRRVKFSEWERGAIIHFYANPDFAPSRTARALGMQPKDLSRLLRLAEGHEMINSLVVYSPTEFWPEYRLPGADPESTKRMIRRFGQPPPPRKPVERPGALDELPDLSAEGLRMLGISDEREED